MRIRSDYTSNMRPETMKQYSSLNHECTYNVLPSNDGIFNFDTYGNLPMTGNLKPMEEVQGTSEDHKKSTTSSKDENSIKLLEEFILHPNWMNNNDQRQMKENNITDGKNVQKSPDTVTDKITKFQNMFKGKFMRINNNRLRNFMDNFSEQQPIKIKDDDLFNKSVANENDSKIISEARKDSLFENENKLVIQALNEFYKRLFNSLTEAVPSLMFEDPFVPNKEKETSANGRTLLKDMYKKLFKSEKDNNCITDKRYRSNDIRNFKTNNKDNIDTIDLKNGKLSDKVNLKSNDFKYNKTFDIKSDNILNKKNVEINEINNSLIQDKDNHSVYMKQLQKFLENKLNHPNKSMLPSDYLGISLPFGLDQLPNLFVLKYPLNVENIAFNHLKLNDTDTKENANKKDTIADLLMPYKSAMAYNPNKKNSKIKPNFKKKINLESITYKNTPLVLNSPEKYITNEIDKINKLSNVLRSSDMSKRIEWDSAYNSLKSNNKSNNITAERKGYNPTTEKYVTLGYRDFWRVDPIREQMLEYLLTKNNKQNINENQINKNMTKTKIEKDVKPL